MDALRDWLSSPFEHEGTMRAGLRSALCMKGHGWNKADLEAEGLINEAFHRLGAKRPTWDQAQAWYTTPRENCLWCFMDLPEEAYSGTRKDRFCSEVCARSALEHRQFERHYQQTEIGNSAYRIISRSRVYRGGVGWRQRHIRPIRNLPLSPQLQAAFDRFLPQMGVSMEVFSGGQPGKGTSDKRVGSVRHDHGNAADVFFYKDGSVSER